MQPNGGVLSISTAGRNVCSQPINKSEDIVFGDLVGVWFLVEAHKTIEVFLVFVVGPFRFVEGLGVSQELDNLVCNSHATGCV